MIRTVMNFVRAAAVCCIVGHPRGHILNPAHSSRAPAEIQTRVLSRRRAAARQSG